MACKKKILLSVSLLSVFIGTIAILLLWGGRQTITYSPSIEAIDKIRAAEKQGTTIEVKEDEVNSILGVYLGKGRSKGNVMVKGLKVQFQEAAITMKMPITYNGIPLLVTAGGQSSYLQKENKIEMKPTFYSLGKLPLPKKLVEGFLEKHSTKEVEFKGGTVKIATTIFPFNIKGVQFKKENLLLSLEKQSLEDLFSNLQKKYKEIDSQNTTGKGVEGTAAALPKEQKGTVDKKAENPSSSNSGSPKESTQSKVVAQNITEMQHSLAGVSSQLSGAMGSLSTAREKQVLQKMIGSVQAVMANPAYDYYSDVNAVMAAYGSLSTEERKAVKSAILSNVEMSNATKIKNTFGL